MPKQYDFGIDYETFGAVDLRRHGLDRYVNHHSFQPLIAVVAVGKSFRVYDFVFGGTLEMVSFLDYLTGGGYRNTNVGVAHNSAFEEAVTDWIYRTCEAHMTEDWAGLQQRPALTDSAVVSRIAGAAGSLAGAARQLTDAGKLEVGASLIQTFCVPNEWNGGKAPTAELIRNTPGMMEKWEQFIEYCKVDALQGRRIVESPMATQIRYSLAREEEFAKLTRQMNQVGWKVDLPLVREMKERYERNLDLLIESFHKRFDPDKKLNLNSPLQLKSWCGERGIRAKSFDKDSVARLEKKLAEKLITMPPGHPRYEDYGQVHAMLVTKQEMGGSSLKKLQVILDQTGEDGRLRDQYVHCGAGQTFRTSGRGVQMQNLKRLSGELFDMESLYDPTLEVDNATLAANLRQVFTASHPDGQLIVGDFSSVESRGLAWLAGADWKIDAFRQGKDLYKVLAAKIYDVPYEEVTKEQRQTGKVGELSCGYGAGGPAVSSFAQGMGIDMDEEAGTSLVRSWRDTNPEIEDMWYRIDDALRLAAEGALGAVTRVHLANGLRLEFQVVAAPDSLQAQHPGAKSLIMRLQHQKAVVRTVLERVFHGVHLDRGRIIYYKPSERITGPAWTNRFTDPKTKEVVNYSIYGGKITGILTQSMCREMFFEVTRELAERLRHASNAPLIGQFHDELVVDWTPVGSNVFPEDPHVLGQSELHEVLSIMEYEMSSAPRWAEGFPLEADIKHAYRYIK